MSNPSSICEVCGTFETALDPDYGLCAPYRVKRTCEVPPLPVIACDDDEYEVIDTGSGFQISARLLDETCNEILDENNLPIETIVV